MTKPLIIAIDFDGTIHNHKDPVEGRKMGPPIEGARAALTEMHRNGHRIIIFTVWGDETGSRIISDWMKYFHIPFDNITNIKPRADLYIDDRAIKFTDWFTVMKEIYGNVK